MNKLLQQRKHGTGLVIRITRSCKSIIQFWLEIRRHGQKWQADRLTCWKGIPKIANPLDPGRLRGFLLPIFSQWFLGRQKGLNPLRIKAFCTFYQHVKRSACQKWSCLFLCVFLPVIVGLQIFLRVKTRVRGKLGRKSDRPWKTEQFFLLLNDAHQEWKYLVEWREGISPSRSPKTGHEPLDSSGSYCPALNWESCQWAKKRGWLCAMRRSQRCALRFRPLNLLYFREAHLASILFRLWKIGYRADL
jgi:hypothetical protein